MNLVGYVLYFALLTGAAYALAVWLARVYAGRLPAVLLRMEGTLLRLSGVDPDRGMGWSAYAMAGLAFNLAGFVLLFAILRTQGMLPLNPDGIRAMAPDLAFNTAVSFVTNTNWQAYSGEAQLSYLSQMAGLTVQNFVSAATGMAVAVAVVRGFVSPKGTTLGNFRVDMTRSVLWILLPMSVILALFLAVQGISQTLLGAVHATGLEGTEQVIARGPAAAQIAIKQLGTNGGGFFGASAAHPFENPTIASNMAQSLSILLIPVAFCFLFGRMVGDRRQGWAIFAAMAGMFLGGLAVIISMRSRATPHWVWVPTWRGKSSGSAQCCPRSGPRPPPPHRTGRSTPCMTVSCRCRVW